MSFKLMPKEKFLHYLEDYLSKNPIREKIDFNSLSDLYSFFTKNKINTNKGEAIYFSVKVYHDFKSQLKAKYNIDTDLLEFDETSNKYYIDDKSIKQLETIIKDFYLSSLSSNVKNIDDDELYRLAVIVNKAFPEVFFNFVEKSISSDDFKKQIDFLKSKVEDNISAAVEHQSASTKELSRYISALIYIVYKNIYPELDIYIPGRTKSANSVIENNRKEFGNQFFNLMTSDFSTGISLSDLQKQLDFNGAISDLSAITIVLSNTNDVLHFESNDPSASEILQLRKTRAKNINFIHSLENYLSSNVSLTNEQLLQIQIELLIRLRDSTFEQCTLEYKKTSFAEILRKKINSYKNNNISSIDKNEVYELIEELKSRVHDKYQLKLLEITIPEVLGSEKFKTLLGVKFKFVKKVIKRNGFVALYYYIKTSDEKIIELQAQTYKRYKDSKDGPSNHSTLEGKEVPIDFFFEPSTDNIDSKIFSANLKLLVNTNIQRKNFLLNSDDSQLTPTDVVDKRKLRAALASVKLKDFINCTYEYKDENGEPHIDTYTEPIEIYLKKFAEFHSPTYSYVVSSAHTRMNSNVAGYSEKSLVTRFGDVLLKNDCTSCLAQILIEKLEEITNSENNTISLNAISQRTKKNESFPSLED